LLIWGKSARTKRNCLKDRISLFSPILTKPIHRGGVYLPEFQTV
jgi:hypothetical protein